MIAANTVVRRLPGPTSLRFCVRAVGGYRWAERVAAPSSSYLDVDALALFAEVPPVAGVVPARPLMVDPATSVWPLVPTSSLLVDLLFARSISQTLPSRFHALGRFLSAMHAVAVAGPLRELPNRTAAPAWLCALPELAAEVETHRAGLRTEARRLCELTLGVQETGPEVRTSLVHGRFSSAQCVPDDSGAVVLGWLEAGIGDPARDAAFLLGELVEAHALANDRTDRVLAAATAFCAGYGPTLPDGLAGLVADRVLDHLALRAVSTGVTEGLLALLRQADAAIDDVLATMIQPRETTDPIDGPVPVR